MEQQRDQSLLLPVILVALVAAGVLLQQSAYEGVRPTASEPKMQSPRDAQSVEARLWQDPFPPAEKALRDVRSRPQAAQNAWAGLSELSRVIAHQRKQRELVVLAVMVPGQPYVEGGEQRRRARHAVLSGLNRAGYVPAEEEHIGFFGPVAGRGMRLPTVVPYEFFEPVAERGITRLPKVLPDESPEPLEATPPSTARKTASRSVLVLWIDDEAFDVQPLRRLRTLLERVVPPKSAGRHGVEFRVIGPGSSAALATMLGEHAKDKPFTDSSLAAAEFFSPTATADDCAILQEVLPVPELKDLGGERETLIERAFGDGPDRLHFLRVSGSDQLQARALLDELERRCVDPAAKLGSQCAGGKRWQTRIALVAEWDTFYGRALPKAFKWIAAERRDARGSPGPPVAAGPCAEPASYRTFEGILRFSYLRGLDGQAAPGAVKPAENRKDGAKSGNGRDFDEKAKGIERPEGNSQFDYLRRLADRIETEDASERIGAIGVLGSDPYDKLLVLQALRRRFPEKVFFTTDLDARLLHPDERDSTRNLIIASTYGLQLHRVLQHDVPPFRDSAQTGVFFATLLALDPKPFEAKRRRVLQEAVDASRGAGWFAARLFEVGRTGPFGFPTLRRVGAADPQPRNGLPGEAGWTVVAQDPNDRSCAEPRPNPLLCAALHPPPSAMAPAVPRRLVTVGLVLVTTGLLVTLAIATQPRRSRPLWVGGVLLHGALAIRYLPEDFGMPAWSSMATWLTAGGAGEPIAFVEGISIWPTAMIRAVALVLALGLLARCAFRLAVQFEAVRAEFCLPALHRPAWLTVHRRQLPRAAFAALRGGMWRLFRAFAAPRAHGASRAWRTIRAAMRRTFSGIVTRRPSVVAALDAARRCSGAAPRATSPGGVDMGRVWLPYRVQMSCWPRFSRVMISALLYFIVIRPLFRVWPPNTPGRGALSFELNSELTMLAVYTALFLTFYVLDATRLCRNLVRRLSGLRVRWRGACVEHYRNRLGHAEQGSDAHLSEWIKMQLIASQSEAIGKLVPYPFIVLALLILARNSLFDHWVLPPSLMIAFGVSGLFALAAAWNLRSAAEEARRASIATLTEQLMAARGAGNNAVASQIDAMIADIRNLRRGAFASYLGQPWLKALLYPLGGLGGGQLLEYLSLVNL